MDGINDKQNGIVRISKSTSTVAQIWEYLELNTKLRRNLITHLGAILVLGAVSVVDAQDVVIRLECTTDHATRTCYLGFGDGAEDGIDLYDSADPPPIPSSPLATYFSIEGCPPAFPNRWRRDIRNSVGLESGQRVWVLHIESGGSLATLSFTVADNPSDYDVSRIRVINEHAETDVPIPGTYEIVVEEQPSLLYLVFPISGPVSVERAAWGSLKNEYR